MNELPSLPDNVSQPAWLLLPRVRVQNANAISSPLTWGFPSITAFLGLMTALERRLGRGAGIALDGVGVICHAFEPQVSEGRYTRTFALTRNPVGADGSTNAIVEEGRVHLEMTFIFSARVGPSLLDQGARDALAMRAADLLEGMRVAGGSVLPGSSPAPSRLRRPEIVLLPALDQDAHKAFRRIARRCLPGFALVSRHDLLVARHAELQAIDPAATRLDAWLDLARWNHRAVERFEHGSAQSGASEATHLPPPAEWVPDARPGWIVPIPVGFAALSPLHSPHEVAGARDPRVPFRFVESVYSIGQWISPHRLREADELFWYAEQPDEHGLYLCANDYPAVQNRSAHVPSLTPTQP